MRNVYKGFVALFNLRLPLFLGSIVMPYIALCYLQCRCKRTHRFSEFKLISEFSPRRNYRHESGGASSSLKILSFRREADECMADSA